MKFLRWLMSWFEVQGLGDLYFEQGLPWVAGSYIHFLPPPIQTLAERCQLRYRVDVFRYTGWNYEFCLTISVTADEVMFLGVHKRSDRQ